MNTVIGFQALNANTTGDGNTTTGFRAMAYNTSGSSNVANGAYALTSNTTGTNNVANGYMALMSNSTGDANSTNGAHSLRSNTTGINNVAAGVLALYSNRGKSESTAIGYSSMFYSDSSTAATVTNNTAIGAYSLQGSTTAANNTGLRNTALGHSALKDMTSGSGNIGIGYNAGSAISTGSNNVVIGSHTGSTIATSSNNILIADGAGNERISINSTGNVGIGTTAPDENLHVHSTGSFSTFKLTNSATGVGTNNGFMISVNSVGAGAPSIWNFENTALSFATNNAEAMRIEANGNVGIGTTSATAPLSVSTVAVSGNIANFVSTGAGGAGCSIAWNGTSCSSDIRLKENIKSLTSSLDNVLRLRSVNFTWKKDQKKERQIGFIAQEIEKIFPEVVKSDAAGFKQVNYANLVAVATEAIKELFHKWFDDSKALHREIAQLKVNDKIKDQKINKLEQENAEIKARLGRIEKALKLP